MARLQRDRSAGLIPEKAISEGAFLGMSSCFCKQPRMHGKSLDYNTSEITIDISMQHQTVSSATAITARDSRSSGINKDLVPLMGSYD